jgi:hypothetical protein
MRFGEAADGHGRFLLLGYLTVRQLEVSPDRKFTEQRISVLSFLRMSSQDGVRNAAWITS